MMKKNNFLQALGTLLICAHLCLLGCTKPNIQPPKPLPPIVKEYKHVTVTGGTPGMKKTGIYIEDGDAYSMLATGSIDYWGRKLHGFPGGQAGTAAPGAGQAGEGETSRTQEETTQDQTQMKGVRKWLIYL